MTTKNMNDLIYINHLSEIKMMNQFSENK